MFDGVFFSLWFFCLYARATQNVSHENHWDSHPIDFWLQNHQRLRSKFQIHLTTLFHEENGMLSNGFLPLILVLLPLDWYIYIYIIYTYINGRLNRSTLDPTCERPMENNQFEPPDSSHRHCHPHTCLILALKSSTTRFWVCIPHIS